MLKKFISVIVTFCLFSASVMAAPQGPLFGEGQERRKEKRPATFIETAVHGVGLGASVGLAAGWVRYYPHKYELQNMWNSVGYGAVAGLGVGLAAASFGPNGTGDQVLTDIERGSAFGGSLGFLAGVVSALFTGDSEQLGSGIAWGQLGGVVLGSGFAIFKIATHRYTAEPKTDTKTSVRFYKDSASHSYPGLCFETKF